mmetsp:Transcript_1508/g.3808  ORF Transcript_1508/g.3808 Transcript_1508/m.3808 type:complete len:388 (-) Transcript_1508:20-1183(-)
MPRKLVAVVADCAQRCERRKPMLADEPRADDSFTVPSRPDPDGNRGLREEERSAFSNARSPAYRPLLSLSPRSEGGRLEELRQVPRRGGVVLPDVVRSPCLRGRAHREQVVLDLPRERGLLRIVLGQQRHRLRELSHRSTDQRALDVVPASDVDHRRDRFEGGRRRLSALQKDRSVDALVQELVRIRLLVDHALAGSQRFHQAFLRRTVGHPPEDVREGHVGVGSGRGPSGTHRGGGGGGRSPSQRGDESLSPVLERSPFTVFVFVVVFVVVGAPARRGLPLLSVVSETAADGSHPEPLRHHPRRRRRRRRPGSRERVRLHREAGEEEGGRGRQRQEQREEERPPPMHVPFPFPFPFVAGLRGIDRSRRERERSGSAFVRRLFMRVR